MTQLKKTLDTIDYLITNDVLSVFTLTSVQYEHNQGPLNLGELGMDIRDWLNDGHEDTTIEETEQEWCIVKGTLKSFVEEFSKINWKNLLYKFEI